MEFTLSDSCLDRLSAMVSGVGGAAGALATMGTAATVFQPVAAVAGLLAISCSGGALLKKHLGEQEIDASAQIDRFRQTVDNEWRSWANSPARDGRDNYPLQHAPKVFNKYFRKATARCLPEQADVLDASLNPRKLCQLMLERAEVIANEDYADKLELHHNRLFFKRVVTGALTTLIANPAYIDSLKLAIVRHDLEYKKRTEAKLEKIQSSVDELAFTREEYERQLSEHEQEVRQELKALYMPLISQNQDFLKEQFEKRVEVERQLGAIEQQFGDINEAYEVTLLQLASANEFIDTWKDQVPEERLRKAKAAIHQGPQAAFEAFREIADEGGDARAEASHEAGKLAMLAINYGEALRLFRKATLLSEGNAKFLDTYGNAARAAGRYSEAESLFYEALAIRRQQLGDQHPDTAASINNLASLYQAQGRYNKAEPLYNEALTVYRQQLGNQHPDIAASINNLASLYQAQGRYNEAELLFDEALVIRRQLHGDQHPDTTTSINNLASLYQDQGRYNEAELLFDEALAIRRQHHGDQHPDTARSINNLALLYHAQGRYTEAESLFDKALAIRRQLLGDQHPDTAVSINNLALLYQAQGRYNEAEPLFDEALAIRRQQLGGQHPGTAGGINNLAALYYAQGRYSKAEPLFDEALAIRRQQLGDQHPETTGSINNLASLYHAQGRYSEAQPLYNEALAIRRQLLGGQHPETARSMNNLASLYQAQGRYNEAEPLFEEALVICRRKLGHEHPSTVIYTKNLAELHKAMGR